MSRLPADRSFNFVELKEGIHSDAECPIFWGDSRRESDRKPLRKLGEAERIVVSRHQKRGMTV
jgi:hypothetical protein